MSLLLVYYSIVGTSSNMSPSTIAIFLIFLSCLCILIQTLISKKKKLPPGPRPLPILGNLHMLSNLPHRSLHDLAKKYGPIMSLRLGSIPTIVVSSPEAAELFLKTHDANFASRPIFQALPPLSYGVGFAEYGPYWRQVRKLCTLHLLCPSKLEAFAPLRREEIGLMVQSLKEDGDKGELVDINEKLFELNENIMYRMVLGCKSDDRFDLRGIIKETFFTLGAFNLADYFPFLSSLDIQGLRRSFMRNWEKVDQLMETIIQDHELANKIEIRNGQRGHDHDFVDMLLSLMNQPLNSDGQVQLMNRTNMKAILFDMIVAATFTAASTVVWIFSELMRHPRVMKNLQQELDSVIGKDRMVQEVTDLPKLGYLNMVVKETFRLHPPGPFLIPHESINDTTVEGFMIAKKSRLLVNLWSIGRDPKIWSENVEEFYPERFLDNKIDLQGQDFQLIPFGSGRRGCPGMKLGLTTVQLMVAHLVHCFDWELPGGLQPQDLDMSEKFELSLEKSIHVLAKPTYRLHI